ncbi:hypothetical protein ACFOHS_08445 [Jhaorihella thermophila]
MLLDVASDEQATDTDPLRDLAVADAPLPAGATRIDKVVSWKKRVETATALTPGRCRCTGNGCARFWTAGSLR